MTDDQARSDLQVMPTVRERIGAPGAVFRRAYSTYPLCAPSRATVLTGRLAHNHHVMGNELPWGSVTTFDDTQTLPVWLHRVGYRTGMIGKYLNGYPVPGKARYVPPGWDVWRVPVDGIYHYYGYTVNVNGGLRAYSQYQSDYVRDHTVTLVKRFAAGDRPFFLWTNFLAPHDGTPAEPDDPTDPDLKTPAVAVRFHNAMAGRTVARTPALDESDMNDKSGFLRNRRLLPLRQLDEAYQQRLESLLAVDQAVAAILTALRQTGEAGNTLVIFTSDNGFVTGQHRWYHKILGYEEATRIPLLMRGPGVPAGVQPRQLVSLADLTATVVAAAGATPTLPRDGRSLLPLARQPALASARSMPLEAGGWPYPDVDRLYTGIHTADGLVLLRWWNGFEEVYDLRADPYELDGGLSPAEAPSLAALRAGARRLRTCSGAGCSSVAVERVAP